MNKCLSVFIMLSSLMIMTSCSNVLISEKDELLFHKIDELQQQVNDENWNEVKDSITELEHSHQSRKWKMQLLGGVSDIEDIEIELKKLKESVSEQEKSDAKSELAVIKHSMYLIYNL